MPDDGHRYELIDGSLLVSPAPCHAHQTVVGNLYVLLAAGGDMSLTIRRPFPVEVVLARLLD